MNLKKIKNILALVKAPLNHPLFFARAFAIVSKTIHRERLQQKLNALTLALLDEFDEVSRRYDRSQVQDSVSVRNLTRARKIASLLINDKGEINAELLPEAIQTLENNLYSLGPNRQYDAKRQEHLLHVLKALHANKEITLLLKKIGRPFSNQIAEDMIRDSLQLPPHINQNDAHARRAVLSAWLCYLRQNVGSCFATAPAEVVHDEQPELFLQDMNDLLSTGRLKRTFGGIEYAVPISSSWGNGDLKKPLLVHRTVKGYTPEIWYSPGLINAFEATGFFKKEDANKDKINQLKDWMEPIFQAKSAHSPYFFITAEEILRTLILQLSGLTEQNIKDYENRPRTMIQSQLMMQSPQTSKTQGGIGERSANFLLQYEAAKNAFKGSTDHALLKAWEFTLASFSETKLEFTTWNLYASLGMGTNEPGGIGECIHHIIQRKLDTVNRKIQDIQPEYEMVYTQVKTTESRIRGATTEKEVQWLKAEYQSRINEFYSLQEQRDRYQNQAQNLVNLYETLHKMYMELFKENFQEVYDADMQEVETGPFDDSPAGFRLLYKHGRSNTAQWTRVKNATEFVEALSSFFSSTEPQIAAIFEERGLEKDLADVVTSVINHVRTKEFLESAFYRMAIAHKVNPIKDPLEHLDQIEKKPWAYTSGGTMNTLVSCYYRLEDKPKEAAKWVESEIELLVFLADAMKQVHPPLLEPYLKGHRTDMLMQSPTHAFILKPMLSPFKEIWQSEEFTYTYVRDRIYKPAEHFVESILLNDDMIRFIIDNLIEKVPENYQPRFKSVFYQTRGPLAVIYFRDFLIETMLHDRGLSFRGRPILAESEIDSFLFSNLPLFSIYELKDRIHQLLILLPGISSEVVEDIMALYEEIHLARTHLIMGSKQLQDACKALLCLSGLMTSTQYNYHLLVCQAAQKLGFALPTPTIFADTNWVKDEFGFVVNPGTGGMELWRVDYMGSTGYPMAEWKQWVNGSRPDLKWGVYVKPYEYGQS